MVRMLAAAMALAVVLAAAMPLAALAGTPSFDCDRARSDVEKLICADDELAALDVRMAKSFATELARAPADAVSGLKAGQRAWRQQLLRCEQAADPHRCIRDAYVKRLDSF